MNYDKRKRGHHCQLPDSDEDWGISVSPSAWCFTRLREFFLKHTHVNSNHPRSKDFFRSRAAVAKEQRRHYSNPNYRHVVHPFSTFAKVHEIYMLFVYTLMFLFDPYFNTFNTIEYIIRDIGHIHLFILHNALNSGFTVNVLCYFFMGYVVDQTREIVLDQRKIIQRYLMSYFFVDVSAMMGSLIPFFFRSMLSKKSRMFIHQLYFFRIARLPTALGHLHFTLKLLNVSDGSVRLVKLLFMTVLFLHWWTCFLGLVPLLTYIFGWSDIMSWTLVANVGIEAPVSMTTRYLEHLLMTMCHFYGAGNGAYRTMNPQEMYVCSLIIMTGIAYYTYALAITCQIFGIVNISDTKYDEFVFQVNEYAITKKLPQQLRRRLFIYYEYKFQRKFFYERAIFDSLSEHLRLEIVLYSCKHLIRSVHVFRGLSRAAIGTILARLKQEVYLPGDNISGGNVHTDLCYFISYGTVACYLTDNGAELIHLEDGDYFDHEAHDGEDVTIKAIETCDVYILPREDMMICRKAFPEIGQHLDKFKLTKEACFAKSLRHRTQRTHGDILMELAHKRIISRGRKR